MYKTILSPITIGNISLKNRIVFAPTSLGLQGVELEEKIRAIARGGCAMVILGDVPVGKKGFYSLHKKKYFEHYKKICAIIHEEGSLACAQLHQSDSNFLGLIKYIPAVLTKKITKEELRPLLNQQTGKLITELPYKKVKEITSNFGTAAILAKKAGFDMVQMHGDRMCGSFSSAIFNERTDDYGGSPENRGRFAVEAVAAVRKAVPDLVIEYKLAVRQENPHYGNAGVLVEELPIFVPLLQAAGVNCFHVALANHGELRDTIPPKNHKDFSAEGCFLPYCDMVRKLTDLPVCAVGGLTSPEFVEEQLATGRVDYVAMSRQLVADPAWPRKLAEHRREEIRPCLRCNKECLGGMQAHRGVHCIYERKV